MRRRHPLRFVAVVIGIFCLVCVPNTSDISDGVGPTDVSIPAGGTVEATVRFETTWTHDNSLKHVDASFVVDVEIDHQTVADSAGADEGNQTPQVVVELTDDQGFSDDGSEHLGLSYWFCDGSADCDKYSGHAECNTRGANTCRIDYTLVLRNVGEVDVTGQWTAFVDMQSEDNDFDEDVDVGLTIED